MTILGGHQRAPVLRTRAVLERLFGLFVREAGEVTHDDHLLDQLLEQRTPPAGLPGHWLVEPR